jgi:hypothetical protein
VNRIGHVLRELYRAEEELADEYVKVGERFAAEHEVWYGCKQFAQQCHARADALRHAAGFEQELPPAADTEPGKTVTAPLRRKVAELVGRRPEPGLLLLDSLRELHLLAQDVSFRWLLAGQVAQVLRDDELLAQVDELHREVLTQIKWLKSQAKQASPQALAAGIPLDRARASTPSAVATDR